MHRGMAADDFDAIGARLAELRKEQDEALAKKTVEGEINEVSALVNSYEMFVQFCNLVDPFYLSGRMSDAIGKIYYVSREPGETRQEFESRVKTAVLIR